MTLYSILVQSINALALVDTSYSFTWLHLSDLHFLHSKKAKSKIILKELLSDIKQLIKKRRL